MEVHTKNHNRMDNRMDFVPSMHFAQNPMGEILVFPTSNPATARPFDGDRVLGGRPAGCPHAYCGCSASLRIFGKMVPDLNLASNWLRRFPHVPHEAAAPGMAAARSHHVMVLESHIRGNLWMVHDGNSGRGLTRVHTRDISRYVIVNPRG